MAAAIVVFARLMAVSFFTVMAVVGTVQQGRNTCYSVKMVANFQQANFQLVVVTITTIDFRCLERRKIGTSLVGSFAAATILAAAIVVFARLMAVSFFTVMAVVGTVQQGRNTCYSVKMVANFQQANFLGGVIVSAVFKPDQSLLAFKHNNLTILRA